MTAIRVRVSLGADPETGIMAMVAYSAAAHVIGMLVILFGPKFLPERTQPPRILTGEIVTLPPAGPPPSAGTSPVPAPAPSTPSPSERAEAAASALKEKRQTPAPPPPEEKPAPKKTLPKEPPKPPPKEPKPKAPVSAIGEERKGESKGATSPQPPASPKVPPGKMAEGIGFAGTEGGTPGGIPSINSSAFPYDWYRTTIVNLIRARWRRPVTPGLTTPLRCSISFVIARNGAISDAGLMEASGFSALDDSALRAVIEASPLPQLPYQYTTDSVGAALVFELTPD